MPAPFLVMATQNPIETDGTYPLPEAQVDRFMMKVLVDYPSEPEEFVIVQRVAGAVRARCPGGEHGADPRAPGGMRTGVRRPLLMQYAVRLAAATRSPEKHGVPDIARYIIYGASPRASINLVIAARALAFVRGQVVRHPAGRHRPGATTSCATASSPPTRRCPTA